MKNSNWKEIEEEFNKQWTHAMQWSDDYEVRDAYGSSAQQILSFFKQYFQEKMHEEAVEELETVNNSLANKNNLV